MAEPNTVVQILKEEYGITTMKELNMAVKKLGFVNISPFCTQLKPMSVRRRQYEKKN